VASRPTGPCFLVRHVPPVLHKRIKELAAEDFQNVNAWILRHLDRLARSPELRAAAQAVPAGRFDWSPVIDRVLRRHRKALKALADGDSAPEPTAKPKKTA
jgi:hypothetical protein